MPSLAHVVSGDPNGWKEEEPGNVSADQWFLDLDETK